MMSVNQHQAVVLNICFNFNQCTSLYFFLNHEAWKKGNANIVLH